MKELSTRKILLKKMKPLVESVEADMRRQRHELMIGFQTEIKFTPKVPKKP